MIRISITANAFLHHMVRNLVGALVYVVPADNRTTDEGNLQARDRAPCADVCRSGAVSGAGRVRSCVWFAGSGEHPFG